jgi:NAD(P)-dependent dehydrogenase (short-subunit alcohol dehydrogenase family)
VYTVHADVTDRMAMGEAITGALEAFGRLDVVVANAGVAPRPATLRTIDPIEFDRVIAINQTGVFNTVKPAIEPIIASRGHVVVVASMAAMLPGPGGAPYMISKAAVEALGRTLRIELAPYGATAGIAYFGIVETNMTSTTLDHDPLGHQAELQLPAPLRRRITANDAAGVIADGITRRAARTIAPAAWHAVAAVRGLGWLIDDTIAGDSGAHELLRQIDVRER